MSPTKAKTPEPNRLIKCKAFDWSPFECTGMFIPFKKGSGSRTGKTRFCVQGPSGAWSGDRKTWLSVESWEYIEEKP